MSTETCAEFLDERRDMLYVHAVRSGDGWHVVLRVDGTYFDETLAKAAAESIRGRMDRLADMPRSGRDWWGGPGRKAYPR